MAASRPPENQRKQLLAFAEAMNWRVVAEYEARESGAKLRSLPLRTPNALGWNLLHGKQRGHLRTLWSGCIIFFRMAP
jgi:hypothetical protein